MNLVICEHFTNQTFKPLSVHEYTHHMQTYCKRKKNHGTVSFSYGDKRDTEYMYISSSFTPSPEVMRESIFERQTIHPN